MCKFKENLCITIIFFGSSYICGQCHCSLYVQITRGRSWWPLGLRSWVCGRSPAEIVGSIPSGGMDVCLLWVLCVVR